MTFTDIDNYCKTTAALQELLQESETFSWDRNTYIANKNLQLVADTSNHSVDGVLL